MLLAYLDESQDPERYWIASLLCPASQASSLGEGLERVAAASEIHGTPLRAELHGHELFHGKGDWLTLSGQLRARIGIFHDALEVVAAHEVAVIIRGVHIAKLEARYETPDTPHRAVLRHSLERIDEHSSKLGGVPVLAIADEVDKADLYRRDLWTFQQYSTPGYRARRLVNFIDTLHFVPSKESRLVQAADLIAFIHQRWRGDLLGSGQSRDERAKRVNAQLWDLIRPRVVHQHCWEP